MAETEEEDPRALIIEADAPFTKGLSLTGRADIQPVETAGMALKRVVRKKLERISIQSNLEIDGQ